jgi:hypothetical protein
MGLGTSYQKYETVLECGSGKAFLRSCISEYSGSVAHRGKIYLETILYQRSLHQNMYLTFFLRNTVAIFYYRVFLEFTGVLRIISQPRTDCGDEYHRVVQMPTHFKARLEAMQSFCLPLSIQSNEQDRHDSETRDQRG